MTGDITNLFDDDALVDDPEAAEARLGYLLRASFLWENRNSIPGAWMMFGGKRPEPSITDPFKPIGEWVSLGEDLWTAEPSEITWWAGHAHPSVRRIVASHETCPPEIIDRLADDPWVEIRQAAMSNMARRRRNAPTGRHPGTCRVATRGPGRERPDHRRAMRPLRQGGEEARPVPHLHHQLFDNPGEGTDRRRDLHQGKRNHEMAFGVCMVGRRP